MPIQVCKTAYSFDELSLSAKGKALDLIRENHLDYKWWDHVYDDAKTIASLMGIEISEIYFSGFSSQGDGACMECEYSYKKGSVASVIGYAPQDSELHDIAKALQAEQRKQFYQIWARSKHRGHYYHSGCTDIDVGHNWESGWYEPDNSGEIRDQLRLFMDWIYDRLQQEYDHLMSDESIKESISSNGYYFNESGTEIILA